MGYINEYTIKSVENEIGRLIIVQDTDATNPREQYDSFSNMICWNNRYNIGDEHDYRSPRSFMEDLAYDYYDGEDFDELEDEKLMNIIKNNFLILPIYAYEHGGITINTSGYSCPWDSGQIGYIYASHKDIENEYGSIDLEKAKSLLQSEVEMFDQYLRGDVYGFVLESKTGCDCCGNIEYENIDSCWGFYGLDYIIDEVGQNIDQEYRELADMLKN